MQSDLKRLLIRKLEAVRQQQEAIGASDVAAGLYNFFGVKMAIGETGRQWLGQLIADLRSIDGDITLMGFLERKIAEFKADKSSNLTYILQNFYIRDVLKQDDKLGEYFRVVPGEESRTATVDHFYRNYMENKSEVPMMEYN